MCGTPRWLTPEVFRGEEYSEKVDVYSYGIVLWCVCCVFVLRCTESNGLTRSTGRELFCFRKPYVEHDPINMAYLVAHEELRPPLLEHIPEMLQRLMAACWHADPAQRPSFHTVVFLLEEAKNAVPGALAIDQDKRFADAAAAHQKLAKYPRKSYGLTSGML